MRFDIQSIVEQEQNKFSKLYLGKKIINIVSDAIKQYCNVAFYGGGSSLQEIECFQYFHEIRYVIDKRKISDKRYISPQYILQMEIDCIIVLPWYSRSEIQYELYKLGYKGKIIDIYECLKENNIHLVKPWYRYPYEIEEKEGCVIDDYYDVEFYLIDAFEIFQFKYLYRKLLEKGVKVRFIAEPNEINISQSWFDFDTAVKILEEEKYNYYVVCNPNAKYAITTQTCEMLDKYNNTKIRYAYGNNMNKKAMSNSEKVIWGFDYSLVAGIWRKKVLSKYVTTQQIVCMGYPKYIEYFQHGVDKNSVLKELGICTDKKILLYLPTWGEWSSIERFSKKIKLLRKGYFIVTKPHHCTARLDSELQNRVLLQECSDMVLDGNYDFTKAITLGDVFICDALSGAATETLYLRKDAKALFVNSCDSDLLFPDVYDLAKVISNPDELVNTFREKIEIPNTRKRKLEEIFGTENNVLPNEVINIFRRE